MNKPKVGILTSFYNFLPTYSLCTVVQNQLVSLVKYGYNPVLFVLPSFRDDSLVPEGVEIRKVVPQAILEPYHAHIFDRNINVPPTYEADVKKITEALKENMKDIDICLTHDFILVDDFLPYAVAIAKCGLPIRWFHWLHSAPSPKPDNLKEPWTYQYQMMPNSKVVYLNNTDLVRVAERYQTMPNDVRIVHNPTDLRTFFNLDPLVSKMIDQFKLFEADIIQIYPVSTPRMVDNKQVNKVIRIFGKLKALGQNVRLIVCNAHANAEKEKDLITNMKQLALDNGLDIEKEVIFTSMIEPPKYEAGVSHNIVKDLFLLSNLFIFPTTSENCPLILLEAASARNLLILNDDFPPLQEFFGKDALYFKFSSLRNTTTYTNEEKYYEDVAKIIVSELRINRPLNAFNTLKQKFNYDYIFQTAIEPLFMEGVVPKP